MLLGCRGRLRGGSPTGKGGGRDNGGAERCGRRWSQMVEEPWQTVQKAGANGQTDYCLVVEEGAAKVAGVAGAGGRRGQRG